jgi:Outer membrane protein beta-barrel domain
MKLRFAAVFALLTFATFTARAQIGFYINPVANHITISTPDSGPFAFLGQDQTSRWFGGVDIGGYYDFFNMADSTVGLKAGLDIRDVIVHGGNAGLNSFLVSPRISVKPFKMPLRPYIMPSIGAGSSHSPNNDLHITRFQYAISAGADYTIAKHVDFRVIEIGYGSVSTVSSGTVGATASIPSANVLNISSGLVFRFR